MPTTNGHYSPRLLIFHCQLICSWSASAWIDITLAHGPVEIAPGTHRVLRNEALRSVELARVKMQPVPMEVGDVLIRHPWTLHRGTPNVTDIPRPLLTVRYLRRWYADSSREVHAVPREIWRSLTPEQQSVMRFPLADC